MFICGVFSLLDRMLGEPFDSLLKSIPVPERVYQALVEDAGPYQPYCELVRAVEAESLFDIRERRRAAADERQGEVNRAPAARPAGGPRSWNEAGAPQRAGAMKTALAASPARREPARFLLGLSDAVLALDAGLQVVFANEAAARLLGEPALPARLEQRARRGRRRSRAGAAAGRRTRAARQGRVGRGAAAGARRRARAEGLAAPARRRALAAAAARAARSRRRPARRRARRRRGGAARADRHVLGLALPGHPAGRAVPPRRRQRGLCAAHRLPARAAARHRPARAAAGGGPRRHRWRCARALAPGRRSRRWSSAA